MSQQHAGGKILAEVKDGVGRITFNQPEKRNAMSVDMWLGMGEVLTAFEQDDAVRLIVLTGAGDKAFVSGADISQFEKQRANADAQKEYDQLTNAGRLKLRHFTKPVIARIRGFCIGGGLAIAMDADIRIASDDSQFGIPAARLGIAYAYEQVRKLVSLVGPAQARQILYTGARMDAREAERIGLVNKVVPVAELDAAVDKLARDIAAAAPLSVAAARTTIATVLQDPDQRDYAAMEKVMSACFDSEDYKEGRRAFMEKRPPVFRGR